MHIDTWFCSVDLLSKMKPSSTISCTNTEEKEEGRGEKHTERQKETFSFSFLTNTSFPSWIQVLLFFSILSKE